MDLFWRYSRNLSLLLFVYVNIVLQVYWIDWKCWLGWYAPDYSFFIPCCKCYRFFIFQDVRIFLMGVNLWSENIFNLRNYHKADRKVSILLFLKKLCCLIMGMINGRSETWISSQICLSICSDTLCIHFRIFCRLLAGFELKIGSSKPQQFLAFLDFFWNFLK